MNDLDQAFRRLRRAGYQIERTRKSHWQIRDRHGRLIATTGSTPGDGRALRNLRADLKRGRT